MLFSSIINIPTVIFSNSARAEGGEVWGVEQLDSRPQLRPATGTHMVLELELAYLYIVQSRFELA